MDDLSFLMRWVTYFKCLILEHPPGHHRVSYCVVHLQVNHLYGQPRDLRILSMQQLTASNKRNEVSNITLF